jgi:hypothetical protein
MYAIFSVWSTYNTTSAEIMVQNRGQTTGTREIYHINKFNVKLPSLNSGVKGNHRSKKQNSMVLILLPLTRHQHRMNVHFAL